MKSPETNPSSVTLNVRKFRERQRERGLIKRELWVRPEYTEALSLLEKGMREPGFRPESAGVPLSIPASEPWSLASLEQALLASPLVVEGKVGVEHLEGAEPSLRLTLHEHGGLAVLLALSGDQILVEAYLWPVSDVRDPAAFNAFALQIHKYLPLSSFSLTDVAGVPSYTLFGALDAFSPLSSVLMEIQSLTDNVFDVVTACTDAGLLVEQARETA